MLELSAADARRLALTSLGLRGNASQAVTDDQRVRDVVARLGYLQVDSVNVFERAHFMPLFSRLGAYDKQALLNLQELGSHESGANHPHLVEYWAHEASLIPVTDLPLFKFRMDQFRYKPSANWTRWVAQNQKLVSWLLTEVREKGPMTVSQIELDRSKRSGSWWGWSDVKAGLEWLFRTGSLTSGGREGFTRVYAAPEQVLPADVASALAHQGGYRPESYAADRRILIAKAADALGVATWNELCDYWRQTPSETRGWARQMLDEGALVEASVEGWNEPAYLGASALAQLQAANDSPHPTTILSPFDQLTWNRGRALRMFGFDYKIEIYVPKEKRVFGYYSLPVLHDGGLVGRLDLKSDRQSKTLLVQSAWHEENLSATTVLAVAEAVTGNLVAAQRWQNLESINVVGAGNLGPALTSAIAARVNG